MSDSDTLLPSKRNYRIRSNRSTNVAFLCCIMVLVIFIIYLYDVDIALQHNLQGLYDKTSTIIEQAKNELTNLHSSLTQNSTSFGANLFYSINPKTIEYFKKQNEKRKETFQSGNINEYYNLLAPEVICDDMIRVGRLGDGGKWICNPWKINELDRKCVIYSFGLNNEISFDKEIQELTDKKCDLVGVDIINQQDYINNQYKDIGGKILITKISDKTNKTYEMTMTDIMKKNGHKYIDFLKIDIESTEYVIQNELLKIPICQMAIELHGGKRKFYEFLHEASKAGYYLAHYEVNAGTMEAQELLLVHEKCLNDFDVKIKLGKFLD